MLVGLALALSGLGVGAERGFQTWRDALRAHSASGRLALVEIDARSLAALDRWPWPRSLHARAIRALNRAGAQTIAFDVDFSARSSPDEDAAFAAAIRDSRASVILPTFRQPGSQTGGGMVENLPLPAFRGHAQLAAVNIEADRDGLVRSYPYGVVTGGVARPSVGAMLAGSVGAAGRSFPIDGAIDPATIPRISFVDLLDGRVKPGALSGKAVLIGATAIEMGDRYPVPRHGVIPGAVIQLLAAETLRQGTSPVDHGPLPLLALTLIGLPFLLRRSQRAQAIDFLVGTVALLVAPLVLEEARLGTLDVVPAEAALAAAMALSAILAAIRAARRARLFDQETGLPNRRHLDELLEGRRSGAVIALRIDGYGDVAGVMGQARAAELVLRLSERLALAVGGEVHRIEASALAWASDADRPDEQVERIEAAAAMLRAPIEIAGRQVEPGFAFGLAVLSGGEAVAHTLLAADHALARGERWTRYTEELDRESDWRLSLAGELDRALASGDIWVAYQPKFDIAQGRITAAEALVRWRHPVRGPIPPDAFIPALEESGRILDLTLYVLECALADARSWAARGLGISVAVNISALLPADPAFQAALKRILAADGFSPAMLTLEVTESAAMSDPEAAIPELERLAAMGIRLSIDDYGTGQSTLSYLKRLPGSEIKIDKSFILALESSRGDQAMVRSTIELAHELGYKVVAEGVETAATLDLLRAYGCDVAQGWHIGRPVPCDEFIALASDRRRAA